MIDKKLKEENERLKAEIDFLKKSQSLAKKLEELTTKDKVKVDSFELEESYKTKWKKLLRTIIKIMKIIDIY